MKLYYAPGACSLADHIALHEAGLTFDRVKVDLKAKRTEAGDDYLEINPKGYVPALELDDGQTLSENIAILSWVADQKPELGLDGALGRYRLLEALAYISTEIHKSFKPFFSPGATDADKAAAGDHITKRLTLIAENLQGDFMVANKMTVADAYLFVMLMWAQKNGVAVPDPLPAYFTRLKAREAVTRSLEHEGLAQPVS